MEHVCLWNTDDCSADREFHPFIVDPVLSQMNPAHTLLPRFFQSHFNVIVLYMPFVFKVLCLFKGLMIQIFTIKARDARRITAAEMKYMRRTAGYIWTR